MAGRGPLGTAGGGGVVPDGRLCVSGGTASPWRGSWTTTWPAD